MNVQEMQRARIRRNPLMVVDAVYGPAFNGGPPAPTTGLVDDIERVSSMNGGLWWIVVGGRTLVVAGSVLRLATADDLLRYS